MSPINLMYKISHKNLAFAEIERIILISSRIRKYKNLFENLFPLGMMYQFDPPGGLRFSASKVKIV